MSAHPRADGHRADTDGAESRGAESGARTDRAKGMADADRALGKLRELLLGEGGLIASLVRGDERVNAGASYGERPRGAGRASPAALAAAGPRAAGRRHEYELVVEAIYEGYLLHYGQPRVLHAREADVGVLAGDRLYAIGLERLVALGDADAVAELADTIMLSALARGAGETELAEAIWEAGARAVGWGASVEHARAKALVLEGSREALEAMRTSAQMVPGTP